VGIARSLAVNPEFIVCDEPTSALDVSVQAQVINLLERLQAELNLTYLFITHDLSVVEYLADEVAVMYQGKIVERGTTEEIFKHPKEAYTRALLSAIPEIDRSGRRVLRVSKPNGDNAPAADATPTGRRPSGLP
jgi:peptide/nickel transport system ATP-binding protein